MHCTTEEAARRVHAVTELMTEQWTAGNSIAIQGFGTFEVKKKMERISVNPQTKERLLIPPKLVLAYRPSNALKEKLKGSETL